MGEHSKVLGETLGRESYSTYNEQEYREHRTSRFNLNKVGRPRKHRALTLTTFSTDANVLEEFKDVCGENGRGASEVLTEFMKQYITRFRSKRVIPLDNFLPDRGDSNPLPAPSIDAPIDEQGNYMETLPFLAKEAAIKQFQTLIHMYRHSMKKQVGDIERKERREKVRRDEAEKKERERQELLKRALPAEVRVDSTRIENLRRAWGEMGRHRAALKKSASHGPYSPSKIGINTQKAYILRMQPLLRAYAICQEYREWEEEQRREGNLTGDGHYSPPIV